MVKTVVGFGIRLPGVAPCFAFFPAVFTGILFNLLEPRFFYLQTGDSASTEEEMGEGQDA